MIAESVQNSNSSTVSSTRLERITNEMERNLEDYKFQLFKTNILIQTK